MYWTVIYTQFVCCKNYTIRKSRFFRKLVETDWKILSNVDLYFVFQTSFLFEIILEIVWYSVCKGIIPAIIVEYLDSFRRSRALNLLLTSSASKMRNHGRFYKVHVSSVSIL